MSIKAAEVKALREQTGCPMMDCKKALLECEGDMEKAVEYLRKKGIASAAKRSERSTAEGAIGGYRSEDGRKAALVELGCETDFVAKNESFRDLAARVARIAAEIETPPADAQALLAARAPGEGKSVDEIIKAQYQTLKENMSLKSVVRYDAPEGHVLGLYVHFNGKIGTMVDVTLSDPSIAGRDEVQALLKDLCMHVAHAAPLGVSRDDIPAELVDKERAVLAELDEVKKKPEKIRPKIVEGKLGKFFQENSLLDQEFVKEKKTSIQKVLQRVGGEVGAEIGIARFVRCSVGG